MIKKIMSLSVLAATFTLASCGGGSSGGTAPVGKGDASLGATTVICVDGTKACQVEKLQFILKNSLHSGHINYEITGGAIPAGSPVVGKPINVSSTELTVDSGVTTSAPLALGNDVTGPYTIKITATNSAGEAGTTTQQLYPAP